MCLCVARDVRRDNACTMFSAIFHQTGLCVNPKCVDLTVARHLSENYTLPARLTDSWVKDHLKVQFQVGE